MKEQIVTFETAELAYLKGLPRFLNSGNDLSCYKISTKSFAYYHVHIDFPSREQYLYAPTQSLLQKWLREVHKLIVIVAYQYEHDSTPYSYWIYKENNSLPLNQWINDLNIYEEALEDGLQEALKLI